MREATPILFLDIDGTVRHGPAELGRFVNRPEDVRVFPEAVPLMRQWRAEGGRIIGVSNQGGIALGYATAEDVTAAMEETYRQTEGLFDLIRHCPHHPDALSVEMARCWCRKPAPGLLISAATELAVLHEDEYYPAHLALMVGDRPEDEQCARAANVGFLWAHQWRETAWQDA